MEDSIFALGQSEHLPQDSDNSDVGAALAQGRTWIAHAHEPHLLATYENRIRRSVEKNTAELRARAAIQHQIGQNLQGSRRKRGASP
ncbi:MAG TPA: hypothetical protein VIY49_11980 [Bryobacteraceae bacterium]